MRIGPYELDNPWILAPMAGVSEMPYRVLVREMGAAAAPTELVSAKGLLHGQKKTARYLAHDACERPFWVQLFGGDADAMAMGAERAAELGAQIIDVNMGCPVRKVIRSGAGAALMRDVPRAAGIVRAIETRTGLPVTAKIRSGWDQQSINAVELTRALADAGCAAVAVHARTRAQGYSGAADWQLIAEVAGATDIPIIGNGDVLAPEDGHRMARETGCAGVMIGRSAMGNPWIFEQLTTGDHRGPTPAQRWTMVRRHFAAYRAFVGDERRAILRFRPHLMWYAHGLNGATAFRRQMTRIDSLSELLEGCEAFFLSATGERSPSAAGELDTGPAGG
ncbi:tRNA dihydrouridine synthase DusB [Myxococcota bacterium]